MQLKHILTWWESLPHWATLSVGSMEQYQILLTQAVAELGPDRDVEEIRAPEADILYASLKESKSEHKAVSVCRVCRAVWNLMIRYELATINPFEKMGLGQTAARAQLWTDENLQDFIAASSTRGLPSMGLLALLCWTLAQRPGDMAELKWEDYRDHAMWFTQRKTKKPMGIKVPHDLAYELDGITRLGPHIITREDIRKPYSEPARHQIFCEVRRLALLPDTLQMRDLRRTGTTAMADAGATDAEMQAVNGISTRQLLNTYQRTSLRQTENAMKKRFGKK